MGIRKLQRLRGARHSRSRGKGHGGHNSHAIVSLALSVRWFSDILTPLDPLFLGRPTSVQRGSHSHVPVLAWHVFNDPSQAAGAPGLDSPGPLLSPLAFPLEAILPFVQAHQELLGLARQDSGPSAIGLSSPVQKAGRPNAWQPCTCTAPPLTSPSSPLSPYLCRHLRLRGVVPGALSLCDACLSPSSRLPRSDSRWRNRRQPRTSIRLRPWFPFPTPLLLLDLPPSLALPPPLPCARGRLWKRFSRRP
jgi:hypothetical protein